MPLIDILFGRSIPLDEAEEDLGRPDKAEAQDLSLHVSRCAKRWALSYRATQNLSAQLARIQLILIALAIYALASAAHWDKVWALFIGP